MARRYFSKEDLKVRPSNGRFRQSACQSEAVGAYVDTFFKGFQMTPFFAKPEVHTEYTRGHGTSCVQDWSDRRKNHMTS